LQSTADLLSGQAAQAGVELVLFHGDVGIKHVSVKGDGEGLGYALSVVSGVSRVEGPGRLGAPRRGRLLTQGNVSPGDSSSPRRLQTRRLPRARFAAHSAITVPDSQTELPTVGCRDSGVAGGELWR
jgi:hypothetical protein